MKQKDMEDTLYKLYPLTRVVPTWDMLFDDIASNNYVKDIQKNKWEEAVEFLRKEIGEGFFNNCGRNHPVYIKLTNAPHLLDDLIDFSNALQRLKSIDCNYEYLLTKLKPREKCIAEGKSFIEIASTYLQAGFEVRFLKNEYSGKRPDMEIINPENGDKFYIEVSKVNDSADRKQTHDEFAAISNTFFNYGFDLLYSYTQLQHIGEDEIEEILARIRKMKDDAVSNKGLEIFRTDKIDLAVAHPSKNDDLLKWCEANDRKKGASGLSVDFNDTPRLVDNKKIYNKIKQIPPGETGILYMPIQFLYFFCMNPADTSIQIMDEISQHPNVLGVVLYAHLGQLVKEEEIEVVNNIRSIKMINGIARHLLFVFNYNYNGSLKEETWQKIKRCF